VFLPDGSLSKNSIKTCKILNLDPDMLLEKQLEEFKAQGLEEHIA